MFSALGVGGLIGTALAGRAARSSRPRQVQAAALAGVGLPMPLLALIRWPAAAIVLVAVSGIGAMLVEILTETGLQRSLDEEVFGRAYGLAIPASYGGIALGSLLAPALAGALGTPGALVVTGSAVLGYAALLLRPASGAPRLAPAREPAVADAGA